MTARYLTPPQVARLYGIDPDTVRGFIESGELKAFNVADRKKRRPRWKISPEALEEFERLRAAVPKREPVRRKRTTKTSKGKEWF